MTRGGRRGLGHLPTRLRGLSSAAAAAGQPVPSAETGCTDHPRPWQGRPVSGALPEPLGAFLLPAAGTVCLELVPLSTLQWGVAGDHGPPTGPTSTSQHAGVCSGPGIWPYPLDAASASGTPELGGLIPLRPGPGNLCPCSLGIGLGLQTGQGPLGSSLPSACPGVGWGDMAPPSTSREASWH